MKLTPLLISLLLVPTPAAAQTAPAPAPAAQSSEAFASMRDSVTSLKSRFAREGEVQKSNDSNAGQIRRIDALLDAISSKASIIEAELTPAAGVPAKKVPAEYAGSLKAVADLLVNLVKSLGAGAPRLDSEQLKSAADTLTEIDSDLELKVKSLRAGRGGEASLVQVSVRARKGAEDLGGYEVWYVLRAWARDATRHLSFDKLSNPNSPPSKGLAPGNYLIWLRKDGSDTPPKTISLGGDGVGRREIDLVIP